MKYWLRTQLQRSLFSQSRVYDIGPDVCIIQLSNGGTTKLDPGIGRSLAWCGWRSRHGYVYNVHLGNLHHIAAEVKLGRPLHPDEIVDHINGDRSDNRSVNLRLVSIQQNSWNRRPNKTGASPYKGVTYVRRSGRYAARISDIWIGTFISETEAGYVYDQWALQLFGTYAVTNFL